MSAKKKQIDFDPYKMLQLEPGCETSQVDKAYKKMALKWHPDKNPEQKDKAKEMFLKIYQAFEFLKDDVAKLEYDEKVAAKRRRAEFEEVRQTTSSAQRKAHLIKLQQAEAKAAKAGQKRKSEQRAADQKVEELRRQGAEMLQRMREEEELEERKRRKERRKTGEEMARQELEQRLAAAQQQNQQQNKQKLSNELDELERALFGGNVI